MRWLKIASVTVVGLVLVVFALMGLLYATRGTPVARSVHALGHPQGLPAVSDSAFLGSIQLLTHTALGPGHTIDLLLNGDHTFPRLWQDLRSARHSIILQLYYCKPGAVADSLKRIISERARAGIPVKLLLDAFGAQKLPDGYRDSLRTAGVRVAEFRPLRWYTLHKAQNRSHSRVVVIDNDIGYTGGFGLSDDFLGDGRRTGSWRETNARFTGPAVAQLQAAFTISWAEATGEVLIPGRPRRPAATADSAASQVAGLFYTSPGIGSTPAERLLMLSVAAATRRIWIANSYFVPDQDLRRLLIAAARRGVDVRVLTAGRHTDVRIVRRAGHALYEELLRGGVRIFEYRPTMYHAKTMVVDGTWSTVGTINFDNRSTAFNEETNLLMHDATTARRLEQHFLEDLRYAEEFELESFTKRSFFSKLVDRAASQITRLL